MKKWIVIVSIVIFVIGVMATSAIVQLDAKRITYTEFMELVENRKVEKVIIESEDTLKLTDIEGQVFRTSNPENENLKELLLKEGIQVKRGAVSLTSMFSTIFLVGVFLSVYLFMNKGRIKGKELVKDIRKSGDFKSKHITFDDVAGNYEAKEMLKDVIDFIHRPEKYEKIGAKMPQGILLYGPPGTGKTLLAKSIAGEAGVPFYPLSGSDFVQMYVGVGAKRVRELFEKARKSKKAIIFIDEIDSLGKSRAGKGNGNNDERDQTLNALLTEMSGFGAGSGIVVIGATNRVDVLDPALLRPGRFDRQIEVMLPDLHAREDILKLYLEKRPVSEQINVKKLACKTVMFSGAMLANLVNEAAIITANSGAEIIESNHIESAFYEVLAGREKGKQSFSRSEQRVTAVHEAGHALLTTILCPEVVIDRITIIPTSKGAAGYNYNIYKDKMYKTKREIINSIKVLLAGRAAEEVVFGKENVTTGCVNDIKEASTTIYDYFKNYGMDEGYGIMNVPSEKDESELMEICREKLNKIYGETTEIIKSNQDKLEKIYNELLEKETINKSDLDELKIS